MAAAVWALTGQPTAVLRSPSPDPARVAAAVEAWRSGARRVIYVTDTAHPPEGLADGYEAADLGAEEAIVTTALSPRPVLPPETLRLDLQLKLYELVPADSG
jgi:hypothetical protein